MPIDPFALKNLFEALDSDISSSLALIKHSGNSPFAHRTYIRTLVSAVEAWVHATGQMLLHEPALHAVPLSPFEIAVLSDETYRVSSKGELEPRLGQPIPLPNRLRFIFRLTARTYGSSYELDVSGRGWQCLNATVALRNRLSHPKSVESLLVSEDEWNSAFTAQEWFQAVAVELQDSCWAALGGPPDYGA